MSEDRIGVNIGPMFGANLYSEDRLPKGTLKNRVFEWMGQKTRLEYKLYQEGMPYEEAILEVNKLVNPKYPDVLDWYSKGCPIPRAE